MEILREGGVSKLEQTTIFAGLRRCLKAGRVAEEGAEGEEAANPEQLRQDFAGRRSVATDDLAGLELRSLEDRLAEEGAAAIETEMGSRVRSQCSRCRSWSQASGSSSSS